MNPSRLAAALADRYHIEHELGTGGMATVYLAEDLKHDRPATCDLMGVSYAPAGCRAACVVRETRSDLMMIDGLRP